MDQATHNKIVSFIWGIADDVLRDLFKRGKYPDVILPMCVIRRMDAVLEPTKQAVLDTRKMLDQAGITEQRAALCDAAGQAFYNTSRFTLRDLASLYSVSDVDGRYSIYLPLEYDATQGQLNYSAGYLNIGTSDQDFFFGAHPDRVLTVTHDLTLRGSAMTFYGRVMDTTTGTPRNTIEKPV